MSKRNIEVKEKALIERLNSRVDGTAEEKKPYEAPETTYVWDNNGPVQFEGNEAWKNEYFSGKTIEPLTVSLSPRIDDGSIAKTMLGNTIEDFDDDPNDRRDSRVSVKKVNDAELIKKLNEAKLKRFNATAPSLVENKDTQMRTPNEEDLPFPGKVDTYEYVNHPKHYNNYDVEVIDMMERVFGINETIAFCKLNAFKYRMRAGTKPNITVQQDLDKEKWYLDKMNELKDKNRA